MVIRVCLSQRNLKLKYEGNSNKPFQDGTFLHVSRIFRFQKITAELKITELKFDIEADISNMKVEFVDEVDLWNC